MNNEELEKMNIYLKIGNPIYVLNILKKYTDEDHMISAKEIAKKIEEEYDISIDSRTVRRNIDLLKYKLDYDISKREENGKGYYISRNPDTDFEPGEIRAIIDTFSYANYIVPKIGENVIKKCKNMQNIYENEKLKDYKIYAKKSKTENMEVIKNIEDIAQAIQEKKKIYFDYWKYSIEKKLEKRIWTSPTVSPYALIYDEQQFFLIAIKEGKEDFYSYRIDRIRDLKILKEKISIKKTNKEITEYAESKVLKFGGPKKEIEAVCNIELLDEVIDQFGRDITIEKMDNSNEFKLKVDTSEIGFKMWAMRNIDFVEVKAPKSLRKELQKIVKEAGKRYK